MTNITTNDSLWDSLKLTSHVRLLLLMALLCLVANCSSAEHADSIYLIGNSLTNDNGTSQFDRRIIENGLSSDGVNVGWHIRTGSTLKEIYDTKEPSTSQAGQPMHRQAYGSFSEALPGFDWDAVTLQIHPRNGATLQQDVGAIGNFIDLTRSTGRNQDTTFYVYAPWPERHEWALWDDSAPDSSEPAIPAAAYYNELMEMARDTHDAEIALLPIGEVWVQVLAKANAGELSPLADGTELTIWDLYRDTLHSSEIGRFINSTTTLATIYGVNPVGHKIHQQDWEYYGGDLMTVALQNEIQQIAWDVVRQNPYTMVTAVPEPSTAAMAMLTSLLLARRRFRRL